MMKKLLSLTLLACSLLFINQLTAQAYSPGFSAKSYSVVTPYYYDEGYGYDDGYGYSDGYGYGDGYGYDDGYYYDEYQPGIGIFGGSGGVGVGIGFGF